MNQPFGDFLKKAESCHDQSLLKIFSEYEKMHKKFVVSTLFFYTRICENSIDLMPVKCYAY